MCCFYMPAQWGVGGGVGSGQPVNQCVIYLPSPGPALHLLNNHLSAFSVGDTKARQVGVLTDRLAALDAAGEPWIAAGDFNALSPYEDLSGLPPDEAKLYDNLSPDEPSAVAGLYDKYASVATAADYRADPPWRTYKPWELGAPAAAIDHVFLSDGWAVERKQVVSTPAYFSDHQPVLAVVKRASSA